MKKLINRMIPCGCEWKCGILIPEFDSQGRKKRFVKGHNKRGQILSDVTKQNMSDSHIGKTLSPETKQKIREKHKGKVHSEEHRKNLSINHADFSGEKHPMFGKHHSPKSKQLMSENHADNSGENNPMYGRCGEKHPMFGKTHSPETRQLMSGENNPNWQGGVSKLPYCPIWTDWLKKQIKERDNFRCQNPDCSHKFEKLVVHHIDYDKKNCSTDNLITLCSSCNGKANFNREHWIEFYNNILKNNDDEE